MDNKKLLKFLFKDIAEIEELFEEKGAEGFDNFEMDFIQSRFKGAKQIIQILSEKENKQVQKIRPRPVAENVQPTQQEPTVEKPQNQSPQTEMTDTEKEGLESLSQFEEELKQEKQEEKRSVEPKAEEAVKPVESTVEKQAVEPEVPQKEDAVQEEVKESEPEKETIEDEKQADSELELQDKKEVDKANNRLGDSFAKEKSVNELLGKDESNKLEYKISNSPVESIKASIGINDRYQYIRELFEGNAEGFAKAVDELDGLGTIDEAVAYLQENYKWKKNEISLKFVNLVKRRFANG